MRLPVGFPFPIFDLSQKLQGRYLKCLQERGMDLLVSLMGYDDTHDFP